MFQIWKFSHLRGQRILLIISWATWQLIHPRCLPWRDSKDSPRKGLLSINLAPVLTTLRTLRLCLKLSSPSARHVDMFGGTGWVLETELGGRCRVEIEGIGDYPEVNLTLNNALADAFLETMDAMTAFGSLNMSKETCHNLSFGLVMAPRSLLTATLMAFSKVELSGGVAHSEWLVLLISRLWMTTQYFEHTLPRWA